MKDMKRAGKRILPGLVVLTCIALISGGIFLQHPQFGKAPSGARLERIKRSPHYRDGKFQNEHDTPTFAEGRTFWGELRKSLFNRYPHRSPDSPLPSVKTDLSNLPLDSTVVIWMGHSSCFIQTGGKRILIDPVFSDNVSPIPGSVQAFQGTSVYSAADMPPIDYLLITHDHYDHLDYETALALRDKTARVICGLGVGAHFDHWGYSPQQVVEKDWHDREQVDSAFFISVEPARHKSGRGLRQNNTLWVSFVIQARGFSIFVSGDGGYDQHFAAIGEKFGPIDLAILENGQYDSAWRYVHLLPEETLQAAGDLKAKKILPVHHSRFALAHHPWREPLDRIVHADGALQKPVVITPMIGQTVYPGSATPSFTRWWSDVP